MKCILGSIAIADLGAVMKNLGRSCTAGEPEQQEDLAWHEVRYVGVSENRETLFWVGPLFKRVPLFWDTNINSLKIILCSQDS